MPPYQPPDDEELRQKALTFLKDVKPQEYRQLLRDGELQEMLRLKVQACKGYAKALGGGPEAWNMAIRQELLESESD